MAITENITESIMVNIMETKHEKNIRSYNILMIICGIGALVGIIWLIAGFYNVRKANQAYAKMQEQLIAQEQTEIKEMPQPAGDKMTESESADSTQAEEIAEKYGIEVPDQNPDFSVLKEENEDIYAWIYVSGTKIDYPILQHPTDNTHYLNYNIDGSKGYPGTIYSENINAKDFSDPHTVLYGHNMKNGSMFAGLHKFEDKDFFEENKYIYIYTEEKTYVYEIYAAYTYSSIHLIQSFDLSNKEIFQKYLDSIFEIKDMNSNMRTDLNVNSDSHILTLSTCISGKPNNRYLVQGVLINED